MNLVEVIVKAHGYYYNHWPNLRIYHNDQEIFDGQIVDAVELKFDLECIDTNTLRIVHYGKRFGEGRVWDSDAEGKQSCYVKINDILFMGITGTDKIVPNLTFTTHWTPKQLEGDPEFIKQNTQIQSHGTMGFNGEIVLEFTTPIYNWLIDKKHKLPVKETAYFSDYSSRWHYEEDIKLLEEIKSLIKYDKNRNH